MEIVNQIKDTLSSLFSSDSFVNFSSIITDEHSSISMYSKINNPYIAVYNDVQSDLQQISSDLLIILMQRYNEKQINYLISQEKHVCVTMDNSNSLSSLHRHNYMEFVYVLEGTLEFLIEGTHKRYYPGEICIINQNVRHVEEFKEDCSVLYLSFLPSYLDSIFKELCTNNYIPYLKSFFLRNATTTYEIDYLDISPIYANGVDEILLLHIIQILQESIRMEFGYRDIILGYLKRFFGRLQDPAIYSYNNTRYNLVQNASLLEQIIAYVKNNPYKITRSELAEHLHYNGNYIGDIFKKATGTSLADFIRANCMHEAANLLLNTNLSISEIVAKIHYENRTVFYKHFKEMYHMLPTEYRNKVTVQ